MDVFKIDLDQSQIRSSLAVVNKANVTCHGGNADDVDDDDEEALIPEVSFDANSDFNLHFFDTPEDSSTQGGFSDPGSVESESLESPTPATAAAAAGGDSLQLLDVGVGGVGDCNSFFPNIATDASPPLIKKLGIATSHKLHTNCVTSTLNESLATSLLSAGGAGAGRGAGISVASGNSRSVGGVAGNSTLASSSAIGHSNNSVGNGGGALYAHSSSNQYNQSHSSSSSSGCSSTSSTASGGGGGCNSSSSNSGSGGLGGSTTAGTALGVEHFIGSNNHTASNVSSTTASAAAAAATSLAHVKLPQGMLKTKNIKILRNSDVVRFLKCWLLNLIPFIFLS